MQRGKGFRGSAIRYVREGVWKSKEAVPKHVFLHKIDHNSKMLFSDKILLHIWILLAILHLIYQKLGVTFDDSNKINTALKSITQKSRYQFWRLDFTICTPIDRAHQTEQLFWRHLMVIYYGVGVVPQKPKFNVNFQENDARILLSNQFRIEWYPFL